MLKIKTPALIVSFVMIVYATTIAQQAKVNNFSLQQSLEYAMKNSPNYLNAELDIKNAQYKRNEIAGIGLPQVSASADVKNYINLPTSLLPGEFFGAPAGSYIPVKFGTKYNATAGFSASQLLFNSDYIFGLSAAKEYVNLASISLSRSKADLYAQVAKAYYNVIINKERIKPLDYNLVRLKTVLDETKAMNVQGFVEKIDVERLEVQYNNLKTERERVTNLLGFSVNLLKFQMGYSGADSLVLTDTLNLEKLDQSILNQPTHDYTKRPDYQLVQAQQKLLDIDVRRLKWGYLPTVAAYGSYQFNAQRQQMDLFDPNIPWYKISLIGASINLNVFDGLQRHNRIQQAKVASQKNENTLKNILLAAELETTLSLVNYENALLAVESQKKNKELATHIYDVTQKKYAQGIGTNIELLAAGASLQESETNYYSAIFDAIIAKIDYLKAIGTITK